MTATLYLHPTLLRSFLEPRQRPPEAPGKRHPWTRLGEDEDRLLTAAKRLGAEVRWCRGAGRAGPRGEWCTDVPGRPPLRFTKASKGELADALEMVLWARGDGLRGALGGAGGEG